MSRQEKTAEVIRQLKNVRDDRGLSLQRIVDMLEERNTPVSMATVRRIFDDGSETKNFRYEDSIKPIADLLLDVQSTAASTGDDAAELDALRAIVRYKNSYIAELEAGVRNVDAKIAAVREDDQRKIDYLKFQIETQNKILDERKEFMEERRDFIFRLEGEKKQLRRIIAVLVLFSFLLLMVIFAALIVDKMNPNMGFFWLDGIGAQMYDGQLTGAAFGVGL